MRRASLIFATAIEGALHRARASGRPRWATTAVAGVLCLSSCGDRRIDADHDAGTTVRSSSVRSGEGGAGAGGHGGTGGHGGVDGGGAAAGSGGCAGVDTSADPLNCGACGHACDPGAVCSGGSCVAVADCTLTPCVGLSYCDLVSKKCLPGCIDAAQCPAGASCEVAAHTCVCPAGEHVCGGQCVSDAAVASCGASCAPCPGDPHGQPSCVAGACGLACDSGYHACGGACVSSASPLTCGASCTPCPATAVSTAVCKQGQCALICNAGLVSCAAGCCGTFQSDVAATDAAEGLSAAVAPDGKLHLSYYSIDKDAVFVASEGSAPWSASLVAQNLLGSTHTGTAFDANGGRHVLYYSRVAKALYDKAPSATSKVVDLASSVDYVYGFTVARGPTGHLHVGAAVGTNGSASRYLYGRYGSSWSTENAASFPGYVTTPAIAVGGDDAPHILYWAGSGAVGILEKGAASWSQTMIAQGAMPGHFVTASAVDAQGRLHVLFNQPNGQARYMRFDAGSPAVDEPVSTGAGDCASGDLAVDDAGRPLVACGASAGGVRLAVRDGGAWTSLVIDPAAIVHYASSGLRLVLDASGVPHVFYAVSTGGIRHAIPG